MNGIPNRYHFYYICKIYYDCFLDIIREYTIRIFQFGYYPIPQNRIYIFMFRTDITEQKF